MGFFSNDEEQSFKNSDSNANVNNNLIFEDSASVVQILLLTLTILKIFEITYLIYTSHVRRIKKRYVPNQGLPLINRHQTG